MHWHRQVLSVPSKPYGAYSSVAQSSIVAQKILKTHHWDKQLLRYDNNLKFILCVLSCCCWISTKELNVSSSTAEQSPQHTFYPCLRNFCYYSATVLSLFIKCNNIFLTIFCSHGLGAKSYEQNRKVKKESKDLKLWRKEAIRFAEFTKRPKQLRIWLKKLLTTFMKFLLTQQLSQSSDSLRESGEFLVTVADLAALTLKYVGVPVCRLH